MHSEPKILTDHFEELTKKKSRPAEYEINFSTKQLTMKLRTRSFEESFDTPSSSSTPKKIKIQKPDDFETVHPNSVTSYGQFGKCEGSECDGVPEETIKINDERLCRTCAIKSNSNLHLQGKTFDKSDAEFKCPAFSSDGSCKSEKISFSEFYLGSCCEQASKWLTENEKARKKENPHHEKPSCRGQARTKRSKRGIERDENEHR
ncbi:Oidioi.mRNA.OKI2018_I69.chr2.g7232.t1.cds [Oikopleura dioica]|uniref:Oidioi.mRNA.OKI2018_I69.chr2.g7232.t1.cds n=1 Tax=Oikopleura dioica TaxID=34765 RepID=A0ABN7TBJ4_OIKDI|nr:Oidioi.mRNA.OKI2018_I69.chr2.g7232.t1.cds [Oikopleura dioica]